MKRRLLPPRWPGLAAPGIGLVVLVVFGPAGAVAGTAPPPVPTAPSATAAACGAALDARSRLRIEGRGHVVAFAPVPAPWRSARHFTLEIEVCAKPGHALPLALKVDADMPAHRHGMNYAATVRLLGPGRYRADGLMFHMPGRWRVMFDLTAGGRLERLAQEVDVP